MKRFAFLFILFSVIFSAVIFFAAKQQGDTHRYTPARPAGEIDTASLAANRKCLACHANRHFEMAKPSRPAKKYAMKMPLDYIIDSASFKHSSHWNFSCTDCHASEYTAAPHDQSLRFEPISTCNDCHGNDTAWSKFGFDTIAVQFEQSVHKDARAGCYSCHDPHATQLCLSRDSMPIAQVVEASNAMCIKCHAPDNESMLAAHEEFPHLEIHFSRSRCIDCHASPCKHLKVAHNIRPKDESVHECSACHNQDPAIIKNLTNGRTKSEEKQSTMAGYFRSNILTACILFVLACAAAVCIAHIIWVLIRKKP